jgi:hypothetical protein
MSLEIRTVSNKKDLKTFVKVPFGIYKGNKCWVPQLIMEEMDIFNPKKNPAHESAESKLFIAYKDGKPVGRIAAILSHSANKKFDSKNLRFGWFDTIEDYEVTRALFDAVENWGRELGMTTLTGPHGYTDLDPEGMLVEGFDQLSTISVYYNHKYYVDLVERYGFKKEIDYVEFKATPPYEGGIPPKLLKLGERIQERSNVKLLKFKSKKDIMKRAPEIFVLLDEAYEEIYGSVPLTEKQIRYYVKKYIPFVNKDLLQVVADENDEVIGFMISLPSLSRAFQKANGRLLPFGWFHILRALKRFDILDFYLAGIKKKYRGVGVDLLMVLEVVKVAMEKGVKFSESNPELETNKKIQAQWKYFNPVLHKQRRIFKKNIE